MTIPTMEDFNRLEKKVDELLDLYSKDKPKTLNIRQLAQRYASSYNHIKYDAPWLMPGFGKSDFPGTARWLISTVEDWEKIPIDERQEMYSRKVLA
ncbi:MAG: hypothetical protein WCR70_03735 [Sphaerochaetaceae bacterium]